MRIETDQELNRIITRVDDLIDKAYKGKGRNLSLEEQNELDKLSDAIEEYENRTDILNR